MTPRAFRLTSSLCLLCSALLLVLGLKGGDFITSWNGLIILRTPFSVESIHAEKNLEENVENFRKNYENFEKKAEFNASSNAACEFPTSSNIMEFRHRPLVRHGSLSYLLPRPIPGTDYALNKDLLLNRVVFLFIHVNKAGGTFIKEEVFQRIANEHQWNGAGFGSLDGWNSFSKKCVPAKALEQSHETVIPGWKRLSPKEAFVCGKWADLSPCGPVIVPPATACPFRLMWGSHAMGLCGAYPKKPCVMLTVLRHPIKRVISQYNYLCIEGKENRKNWKPAWKEANFCPLSLLEFADSELTSQTFLIDHMARAADSKCGLVIALRNLQHPCLRFLLLDKLVDGLQRLTQELGPAFRPVLEREARDANETLYSQSMKNHTPYPNRTMVQVRDAGLMKELTERYKLDVTFYEKAVELYEKQWEIPLQSCNPIVEHL